MEEIEALLAFRCTDLSYTTSEVNKKLKRQKIAIYYYTVMIWSKCSLMFACFTRVAKSLP